MTDADSLYPKSHRQSRMSTGPYPQGYDRYLATGPGAMAPGAMMNAADSTTDLHRPLLNNPLYYAPQQMQAPPSRSRTPSGYNYSPSSIPPSLPQMGSDGYREAPLHRPQTSGSGRPVSSYEMSPLGRHPAPVPGYGGDYFAGGYR